jgi:hypothetical protein
VYWDFISDTHYGNIMGGLGFCKDGSVKNYNIENGFRWLVNDPLNCEEWSVSNDSIFTSKCPDLKEPWYTKMKIIKCTDDTIIGEGLIVKGKIMLVKVRDLKTIIKPDNPIYKKRLENVKLIRRLSCRTGYKTVEK